MSRQNIRWRIPALGLFALLLAVDSFAKSAEEWYQEGVKFSLNGFPNRAAQAFRQALSLKPDWAEAHHALGVHYFNVSSGPQSVNHLRKAARYYRKRTDPQARKNLTIVEKNLDKAYAILNIAPEDFDDMELDPGYTTEIKWQTAGAGFLIGDKGFILASDHNLGDAKKIKVRFVNGAQSAAILVKLFLVYNVAVLKLEDSSMVPKRQLSFGNDLQLREGNPTYFIDLKPDGARIVQGPVLAINALEGNAKLLHIGIPLKLGHSGGPLLNRLGEVMGMAFSTQDIEKNFAQVFDVPKDTGFALKSSYLQNITSDIFKAGYSKAPGQPNHPEATQPLAPAFHLNEIKDSLVSIETSQTP